MPKVTLPSLASGYLSTDTLNEALETIQDAFDNTLSRDGSTPNTMSAALDMNGNAVINIGASTDPTSVVSLDAMQSYVDSRASGMVVQKLERHTAASAQTAFTLTTMTYEVGANNLAVYVNGVRKFAGHDYTETSATVITFLAGQAAGAKVDFVTNDYLATIALDAHTHAWSDLTGVPSFATRWPTWTEVTDKPTVFTPDTHTHTSNQITAGTASVPDGARGVYVQSTAPTATRVGDLWIY